MEAKNVYNYNEDRLNLDILGPYEKKVINYIKNHGYGCVYAVVKNDQLLGFTIDGEFYDTAKDPTGHELFKKLEAMGKAVFDFEEEVAKTNKLPSHFSTNHLVNHPRWIMARRQYGFTKQNKNEYLISSNGIPHTVEFWEHFLYFSIGEGTCMFDEIDYTDEITLADYENNYKNILFLKDKYHLNDILKKYIAKLDNANMDDYSEEDQQKFKEIIGKLKDYHQVILDEEEYSDSYEELKSTIYKVLGMIDENLLESIRYSDRNTMNHEDLIAFVTTSQIRDAYGIKATYSKNIGFPLICLGSKKYDYRIDKMKRELQRDLTLKSKMIHNSVKTKKKRQTKKHKK